MDDSEKARIENEKLRTNLLIKAAIRLMIASFLIAFVISFTNISSMDKMDLLIRSSGVYNLSGCKCYLNEVRSNNIIVKNYLNSGLTKQIVIICNLRDKDMVLTIYEVPFFQWFRRIEDELKHNSSEYTLRKYRPEKICTVSINDIQSSTNEQ